MPKPITAAEVERALLTTCGFRPWDDGQFEEIAQELEKFKEAYRRRYHSEVDPFGLMEENPGKAGAFFETYSAHPLSPDMMVAVWRLIWCGDRIKQVQFHYDEGGPSRLTLILAPTGGGPSEPFEGSSLWDFEVLKHLGILSLDGRPLLDGYYPIYT